jgi:hypothetical protein
VRRLKLCACWRSKFLRLSREDASLVLLFETFSEVARLAFSVRLRISVPNLHQVSRIESMNSFINVF